MLSLLYYITVTIICFVLYLLSWIAFFICYPFDKRRVVVHFISKLITDTVLGIFGREVIGGENIDPKTLQNMAGHADHQVTMNVYVHAKKENVARAGQMMDELLGNYAKAG